MTSAADGGAVPPLRPARTFARHALRWTPLLGSRGRASLGLTSSSIYELTIEGHQARWRITAEGWAELIGVGLTFALVLAGAAVQALVAPRFLPVWAGLGLGAATLLLPALRHRRGCVLRHDRERQRLKIGEREIEDREVTAVLVVSRRYPIASLRYGLLLCFADRPPLTLAVDRVPEGLQRLALAIRAWLGLRYATPPGDTSLVEDTVRDVRVPGGSLQVVEAPGELRLRYRPSGFYAALGMIGFLTFGTVVSYAYAVRMTRVRIDPLWWLLAVPWLAASAWMLIRFVRQTTVLIKPGAWLSVRRGWRFGDDTLPPAQPFTGIELHGGGEERGLSLVLVGYEGFHVHLLAHADNQVVERIARGIAQLTGRPLRGAQLLEPDELYGRNLHYEDAIAGFLLRWRDARPSLVPADPAGTAGATGTLIGAALSAGLLVFPLPLWVWPLAVGCTLVAAVQPLIQVSRVRSWSIDAERRLCLSRASGAEVLDGPVTLHVRDFRVCHVLSALHNERHHVLAVAERPDVLRPLARSLRTVLLGVEDG